MFCYLRLIEFQVNLVEPQLAKNEKERSVAKLSKQHNIEWEVVVAAGESKEFRLKYILEYPRGENLEFTEDNP